MNVQQALTNLKDNLGRLNSNLELLKTKLVELKGNLGGEKAPEYLLANGLHGNDIPVYGDSDRAQKRIKKTFSNTAIYDVRVLSQTRALPGSSYYRTLYGCGFQAIKNMIFITKILQSTPQHPSTQDIQGLTSAPIFLNYFEHNPFQSSWYSIWKDYRIAHNINWNPMDDPPTQDYDLENLKTKIIEHKARAPEHAREIMDQANIFEYLEGGQLHKTTLADALLLIQLAQDFQERDSVILPCALAYTHHYTTPWQAKNPEVYGSLGRHWIAVVVNKWHGSIEAFFADGWRNSTYTHKNWGSVELLLQWLLHTNNTVEQYFNALEAVRKQPVTPHELQKFQDAVAYIVKSPRLEGNAFFVPFKGRLIQLLGWYKDHAASSNDEFGDMLKSLDQ